MKMFYSVLGLFKSARDLLSTSAIDRPPSYLFHFRAVKVPPTDLVVAGEHVHGHHTDGEGHCTHDYLPGVRGHQEAVHTEETRQHGWAELGTDTNENSIISREQRPGISATKTNRHFFSFLFLFPFLRTKTIRGVGRFTITSWIKN